MPVSDAISKSRIIIEFQVITWMHWDWIKQHTAEYKKQNRFQAKRAAKLCKFGIVCVFGILFFVHQLLPQEQEDEHQKEKTKTK